MQLEMLIQTLCYQKCVAYCGTSAAVTAVNGAVPRGHSTSVANLTCMGSHCCYCTHVFVHVIVYLYVHHEYI